MRCIFRPFLGHAREKSSARLGLYAAFDHYDRYKFHLLDQTHLNCRNLHMAWEAKAHETCFVETGATIKIDYWSYISDRWKLTPDSSNWTKTTVGWRTSDSSNWTKYNRGLSRERSRKHQKHVRGPVIACKHSERGRPIEAESTCYYHRHQQSLRGDCSLGWRLWWTWIRRPRRAI